MNLGTTLSLIKSSQSVFFALLIGGLGGVCAYTVGMPAPWLSGPALFVSLAALLGLKLSVNAFLRDLCFLLIGMTTGANVTRETLATAWQWPIAIITLIVGIVTIVTVSYLVLRRFYRYDRDTALLASSPGHLSYILSLSTDTKADIKSLSIIQSIRVLFLTIAVPFLALAMGAELVSVSPFQTEDMTWVVLGVTAIASVLCGLVFKRLRIPASFLLGGMVMSSAGHLTELGNGLVPLWISTLAFIVMGTIIGTRFSGVSLAVLKKALSASFITTFIAVLVSAIGAIVVSMMIDVPLTHILVAFAPGGLETMAAMAILLQANPAFVAAHHVSRILFLTVFVPMLLRRK